MTREEAIQYLKNFIEECKNTDEARCKIAIVLAISTLNQMGEFK